MIFLAFKTDMSKAYNWVNEYFLQVMLSKLGFGERWIHLVMACVYFVSNNIVVNGALQDYFTPLVG